MVSLGTIHLVDAVIRRRYQGRCQNADTTLTQRCFWGLTSLLVS